MSIHVNSWRSSLLALLTLGVVLSSPPAVNAGVGAPTPIPFTERFVDVNPCTGVEHTITGTGTFFFFERGNGLSHRLDLTISTSSGFTGHSIEISVDHDRIFLVRAVLTNGKDEHILAQVVLVHDASGTLRVERFDLDCA